MRRRDVKNGAKRVEIPTGLAMGPITAPRARAPHVALLEEAQ